ncbi:restriction endonuclease [Lacrimispora celerecrescens]|uniref:restriction endonuclease n=1 Tax=Lacrimispora celerecrescens TaxID=29354 RepID=UPI00068C1262|nr:restriction endonuclease [Lacrimispora celerecrescens]
MSDFDFYDKQIRQYQNIQKMLSSPFSPVISQVTQMENVVKQMTAPNRAISSMIKSTKALEATALNAQIKDLVNGYEKMSDLFLNIPISVINSRINNIVKSYKLCSFLLDEESEEDIQETKQVNENIVTEILKQNIEKSLEEDSPIIVLSPVNETVLKYLAENPQELYHLHDREFEKVMAEIYCKLGYKVDLTQETRDGGKDIIIRKPEALGDFVYYVECKKYSSSRHIGVGIIRNLVGTINTDRVNGGILATTSFFTRDAKKFIIENKLNYQIQTHDYNRIRDMLNAVV